MEEIWWLKLVLDIMMGKKRGFPRRSLLESQGIARFLKICSLGLNTNNFVDNLKQSCFIHQETQWIHVEIWDVLVQDPLFPHSITQKSLCAFIIVYKDILRKACESKRTQSFQRDLIVYFHLVTSSVTSRIYIATLHKNPYVSDPIV
jgi:hypothetical protein